MLGTFRARVFIAIEVHILKKIVGLNIFSAQFMVYPYEKIGYNIIVLRQTACLVVNQGWQLCLPL